MEQIKPDPEINDEQVLSGGEAFLTEVVSPARKPSTPRTASEIKIAQDTDGWRGRELDRILDGVDDPKSYFMD